MKGLDSWNMVGKYKNEVCWLVVVLYEIFEKTVEDQGYMEVKFLLLYVT